MRTSFTLLAVSFNALIKDWKRYFLILLVPSVLSFFVSYYEDFGTDADASALSSILLGISTLVSLLMAAALVYAAANRVLSAQESYKKVLKHYIAYLALALGYFIIIVLGLLLLIIPGLYFTVVFSFAFYFLLLENKSITESLSASRELVRGHFWDVAIKLFVLLLITIAGYIVIEVATSVVSIPLGDQFQYALATALGLIMMPLSNIFMYEMYKDLKGSTVVAENTV